MTTETEHSPMQVYQTKLAMLNGILVGYEHGDAEFAVLSEAIKEWERQHRSHAEYEEKRFRTRYYCAICYGEIPHMQEAALRGSSNRTHRVCEHLYLFDMAGLRKQIAAQRFEHDPHDGETKGYGAHGSGACPVLTDGWPTMHPKRSTFEERR